MNSSELYDEYIEKLLVLQFEASKVFKHNPTKGDIREAFIKDVVCKQFSNIKLYKGALIDNEFQSSQIDIIATLNSDNPQIRVLGDNSLVDIKNAKLVVEVKSSAKTIELKELNDLARVLKNLEGYNGAKIGMFMYDYDILRKNMLKKFGFRYESNLDAFENDGLIEYNYIDFAISLDPNSNPNSIGKAFFVIRDINGNRFSLYSRPPSSKHFMNLFKN